MNYKSSLGISFVYPMVISILEALMLVFSFVNKELYGSLLLRYRIFYSSFLIAGVFIMALNMFIKRMLKTDTGYLMLLIPCLLHFLLFGPCLSRILTVPLQA